MKVNWAELSLIKQSWTGLDFSTALNWSEVQCSAVQCSAAQRSAEKYSKLQRTTLQYSTVQYSTVQHNIKWHNSIHFRRQTADIYFHLQSVNQERVANIRLSHRIIFTSDFSGIQSEIDTLPLSGQSREMDEEKNIEKGGRKDVQEEEREKIKSE